MRGIAKCFLELTFERCPAPAMRPSWTRGTRPRFQLQADDLLLAAGAEEDIARFSEERLPGAGRGLAGFFRRFLQHRS